MTNLETFEPDWISPPGDTILDLLEERGWTQVALAERLDFTKKHVSDLVHGRASITPDTALRLESIFGAPADFWLSREAHYQEAIQREHQAQEHAKQIDWLKELPISHMVKFGWVQKKKDKGEQVAECLSFFGVASVSAWRASYEKPLVAFRASPNLAKKTGSVAAWLRRAQLESQELACEEYERSKFMEVLTRIRELTNESNPNRLVPKLQQTACETGVAVVFVPAPRGCPVSGATQWLASDRPMIALSLRHKSNDHLWFTFFHEAAHILHHGKKKLFVEFEKSGMDSEKQEREANLFAANFLIPKARFEQFEASLKRGQISAEEVKQFADEIGIAPGIVVGRLQKEKLLPWKNLNFLKIRFKWASR